MKFLARLILFPYQVIRGCLGVVLLEIDTVVRPEVWTVSCPSWIGDIMSLLPIFKKVYEK